MTADAPRKKKPLPMPKKSPAPKPPMPKCNMLQFCPLFNEKEAQMDKASTLNFLVQWLERHKEYLKTYPPRDSRAFSMTLTGTVRNYPAIDCAKSEYNEFVAKMRHGKCTEPPYENPFTKKDTANV